MRTTTTKNNETSSCGYTPVVKFDPTYSGAKIDIELSDDTKVVYVWPEYYSVCFQGSDGSIARGNGGGVLKFIVNVQNQLMVQMEFARQLMILQLDSPDALTTTDVVVDAFLHVLKYH